ncbi:hypothetical protein F8388_013434 [Cannabis sativa]|uniref:Retrotransposon gag domain-containing protein n=1 Tax=Cannabis sativa TaxID=3483 RepID=A0A7J6HUM1_CANSA|nr:hypothetical protein F8388_013434 [Cannabis sativa]KAF4398499.1 hypothetical protein G4B88_025478 [Cannabis sativa]
MANEQEDLILQNNPDNHPGAPQNTVGTGEDATDPIPPWREILERLKQQEGKMATQGMEIALQKENIQRLESKNGQMKVVLEGYQRPPHAEETGNRQMGGGIEKENHTDNKDLSGNHNTRCMHEEMGEKGNLATQEALVPHRDQPRSTRDEVEEITEAEALRTTPRKRIMDPTVAGNLSAASKETERLQEMMWNKLIALEAKSQMGVHTECARMEGSTLSPFGNHILRVEAPQHYVDPKLPEYNGTGEPSEYVCQFEQKMLTVSVPLEDLEVIKCKTFTQGLKGPALRWFHNLPSGTVNSYQDLILRFQANFAISVRTAKVDTDLMLIHQRLDEPLEHFINRFSEEYVSISKCTDSVATKALMQRLIHGSELKKAIIVEPGLSLTRALTMARGYVALEVEEKRHNEEVSSETLASGDTFLFESKNRTPTARPHNRTDNRSANERNSRGTVMMSMGEAVQPHAPRGEEELPRMPITLIELIKRLRGLKETKSRPCNLRVQAAEDRGQPSGKRRILPGLPGEASELEHPHDDALVITLDVAHVRMKRMLVDTGSSANILFAGVLKEMEIEDLKAQDTQVTLVGFSGESVVARSFVQLPVYANGVNKLVKFLIVDCPSAYNAILGRSWIHAMKAVASSYHQVIKFPCKGEVREIRRDQLGARECYSSSLRNKNKL